MGLPVEVGFRERERVFDIKTAPDGGRRGRGYGRQALVATRLTTTSASTSSLTVLGHTLTLVRSAPVQADRGQDAGLGPAKPGKGEGPWPVAEAERLAQRGEEGRSDMTVGKLVLILALAFVVGITFAECVNMTLEQVVEPSD